MSNFIALKSPQPGAIARYKREVRAIVVDRAADYIDQLLPGGRKPSNRSYEKAFQEGLRRAKLDVMAELFRIMHDLARPSAVSAWSRGDDGLRRRPHSTSATMNLLVAYEQVVRYVAGMRAHVRKPPMEAGRARAPRADAQ